MPPGGQLAPRARPRRAVLLRRAAWSSSVACSSGGYSCSGVSALGSSSPSSPGGVAPLGALGQNQGHHSISSVHWTQGSTFWNKEGTVAGYAAVLGASSSQWGGGARRANQEGHSQATAGQELFGPHPLTPKTKQIAIRAPQTWPLGRSAP